MTYYTIKIIAALSLSFIFFSSTRTQQRIRANETEQNTQQAEKESKIHKGLKISIIGIKRKKVFCLGEITSNLPCYPGEGKASAKPGEDLVVVHVRVEKLPEFKETKLQISRYELYDAGGKKHISLTENIDSDLSEKGDILGFLCSVPEGTRELKTLKIVFVKPESLVGELSLNLEKYKAEGKK